MIEVFADVVCPFAHVGLHRWVARRAELRRPDVLLRVRAWPLEVINGAPMDPGAVDHKVHELQGQVAPDLFTRFDAGRFPTTSLPALALTNAAYRIGGPATGEAMALHLRHLLWDEGVDVAQPDVLATAARQLGVEPATPADHEAALADLAEGRERGVVGSPHFFTPDGGSVFCPSLDIARAGDHLDIHVDFDAFNHLIEACFA